jgi:WXG100 family type VII secretion target
MASDAMQVNYAAIHQGGADCTQASTGLSGTHEDLHKKISVLTSEGWSGASHDSYLELQKSWDNSHQELLQVIAQIGAALPHIADGYQHTEDRVKGSFQGQ